MNTLKQVLFALTNCNMGNVSEGGQNAKCANVNVLKSLSEDNLRLQLSKLIT